MAERRMFAKTIIDSDAFLDMPLSSQALYFHLNMRADDDGFINNPKKIARMIGASDDDLKILMGKSFIIPFESGVVVIKHWRINNYIRNDRYHTTVYQEEKETLSLKENGAYTLDNTELLPLGIPMVDQMETEVRLGKDNINKYIVQKTSQMTSQNDSVEEIFESLWKLYPVKKGKGQISDTKKKKIASIGIEEMTRAINRFVNQMEKENRPKQYIMQGSTFFNSGYVDYLDKNYEAPEHSKDLNKFFDVLWGIYPCKSNIGEAQKVYKSLFDINQSDSEWVKCAELIHKALLLFLDRNKNQDSRYIKPLDRWLSEDSKFFISEIVNNG